MTSSNDTEVAEVARRFLEQRRQGRRVSVDDVLATMAVDDPQRVRSDVVRTIANEARLSRGATLTHGSDELLQDLNQLPEFPELEGYDIIDHVGRGGMGQVYEAYQQSTGRRVAIKFMLDSQAASPALRRRFEREVELVAKLEHPNIVSIIDSGIHSGRYYYVMDYVGGAALDEAFVPGKCEPREVVSIIRRVCETVDYAHQHGVLHRDLKPSNILIDERGEPHVLDFGLAKAIDPKSHAGIQLSLSEPGQLLGTLGYMSPEQSQGQARLMSVRSDVYSLGSIFYELLTGELPLETTGSLKDVLYNIAEQDPMKPSQLRDKLDGDLDAILLKCLEKAPQNRYATAGALGEDLRRYLADENITARRPSTRARMMRWVRRNRAVATVGGIAVGVLLVSTAAYIWNINRARRQAEERVEFLRESLVKWSAQKGESRIRDTAELIDYFAVTLDSSLSDQPKERAILRTDFAGLFKHLEEWEKAREQYELALQLRIESYGPKHPLVAESYHNLGSALWFLKRYEEARENYLKALEMRTEFFGPDDDRTLETKHHLAVVYMSLGDLERSERLQRENLALRRKRYGEDHLDVAATRNNLANLLMRREQYAEAEQLFRSALRTLEKLPDRKFVFECRSIQNVADCLMKQGKYEAAEPEFLKALEMKEQVIGKQTPTVAMTLHSLAELMFDQDRFPEGIEYTRRALELGELFLREHLSEAESRSRQELVKIREVLEVKALQNAEAENLQKKHLTDAEAEELHALERRAQLILARSLLKQEKYPQAEMEFLDVLRQTQDSGADALTLAGIHHGLAETYYALQQPRSAKEHCLEALEIRENRLDNSHKDLIASRELLIKIKTVDTFLDAP